MRDVNLLLQDIMDSIESIKKHLPDDFETFQDNELINVFVIHHLSVIGEAVTKLPIDLKNTYPEIEWKNIVAMRNILVHSYYKVGLEYVWNVAINDLGLLQKLIKTILDI